MSKGEGVTVLGPRRDVPPVRGEAELMVPEVLHIPVPGGQKYWLALYALGYTARSIAAACGVEVARVRKVCLDFAHWFPNASVRAKHRMVDQMSGMLEEVHERAVELIDDEGTSFRDLMYGSSVLTKNLQLAHERPTEIVQTRAVEDPGVLLEQVKMILDEASQTPKLGMGVVEKDEGDE